MILFRADGNKSIGVGHVMRCLSIADALKEIGVESIFVNADSNVRDLITNRGFDNIVMGTDYKNLDAELVTLLKADFLKEAEAIVVDSYFVSKEYLAKLNSVVKTIYIDDYFTDCQVYGIINYNIYAEKSKYDGKGIDQIQKYYLGPKYAPLRKDFSDCKAIDIKENVKDILVLSGGSDPFHVATELAKEIEFQGIKDLNFHFVCGGLADSAEELKRFESRNNNIKVHFDVKDMKSLMCSCDMAISAAGSTMYELCACGVPTINYSIADNQRLGAEGFANKGIMMTMGMVTDTKKFCKDVQKTVRTLSSDYNMRTEMSSKSKDLIDGKGAVRLAMQLKEMIKG